MRGYNHDKAQFIRVWPFCSSSNVYFHYLFYAGYHRFQLNHFCSKISYYLTLKSDQEVRFLRITRQLVLPICVLNVTLSNAQMLMQKNPLKGNGVE